MSANNTDTLTMGTTQTRSQDYTLTKHASERIRQRVGIESVEIATQWVSDNIAKATRTIAKGDKTHYITDTIEIIATGLRVITVQPVENDRLYLDKISAVVEREVAKLIAKKEREMRRVEIRIAEHTLNRLRAKNPNTVALIGRRLVRAIDEKQRLNDEVYAIGKAGSQYGVNA